MPLSSVWAAGTKQNADIPILVDVLKVQLSTSQGALSAPGSFSAEQGVNIKAETIGRLTAIYVNSGQYVQAGQPIIQIYPDILEAQLRASQAQYSLDQVTYERNKKLFTQNAVAREDLDTAAANMNKSAAAIMQIQAQLNQALIRAPFSGFLGILKVNLGDYITPGQLIVSLQNTNPIYVDFSIPEQNIPQVKVGQNVSVHSQATGQQTFTGKVIALDSSLDPTTRTLLIRAAVPNPQHILLPGMFGLVKVFLGSPNPVIKIPQTAVAYAPDGAYVYRIIQQKAVKTPIKLGEQGTHGIIILSGLSPGDVIVAAGQQKLHDGALVQMRWSSPPQQ